MGKKTLGKIVTQGILSRLKCGHPETLQRNFKKAKFRPQNK